MTATIACVDVGQGDCTVAVDADSGDGVLIDCRGGHHQAAVKELRALGLTELRAAIVSHTHQDHFGGVLDVLEELADRFTGTLHFNQDTFLVRPVAGPDRKVAGRRLRALLLRAGEYGDRVHRAEVPTAPGTAGSINWQLLAPTYAEVGNAMAAGDPNLASGVVLIQVGANGIVIGADAQLITWQRIATQIPKGSVVRWPHHGGELGPQADADAQVLAILQPATVIVSVGATNGAGHPTQSFFAALAGHSCRLLCTEATPACVAGGGPGAACAGTVRVRATGSGNPVVTPTRANHAVVIAAFGNGQCT